MARNENRALALSTAMSLIPAFIDNAELVHGAGSETNDLKHSFVTDAVIATAGGFVAANNPGYADTINKIIQARVALNNRARDARAAQQAQSPVNTSAPAPVVKTPAQKRKKKI